MSALLADDPLKIFQTSHKKCRIDSQLLHARGGMGIVGGMGIAGSCLLQGIECMGLGSSCPSFAMQRVMAESHGVRGGVRSEDVGDSR